MKVTKINHSSVECYPLLDTAVCSTNANHDLIQLRQCDNKFIIAKIFSGDLVREAFLIEGSEEFAVEQFNRCKRAFELLEQIHDQDELPEYCTEHHLQCIDYDPLSRSLSFDYNDFDSDEGSVVITYVPIDDSSVFDTEADQTCDVEITTGSDVWSLRETQEKIGQFIDLHESQGHNKFVSAR